MTALVYGGSGSGKSAWAEELCIRLGERRLYLATMEPRGEEAAERVRRHREQRADKGFDTLEHYGDPRAVMMPQAYDCLLLECGGNLVSNLLFGGDPPANPEEALFEGVRMLAGRVSNFVFVTNDVFADGVSHEDGTARFAHCLAGLNRRVAAWADAVVEVVCGLPICHKGEGVPL